MKDILVILRRNFLSTIVIAILVLSFILLILNEKRDALFLSFVVVLNTILAVVQEIRAERALKKLELMSTPRAHRLVAGGNYEEVMFDQLTPGDTIKINLGDEVPADGRIIASQGLEVDESVLTGESIPVEKPDQALVYAATAVSAGSATVLVTAVGKSTKVGSMTATLKRYVPHLTPLQHAIARAITWLTYGALGLALLIAVVYHWSGQDVVLIFKTITSAAVTIVPEGLLLASSLLLAFGSIRLAQAQVLPQKLAAIEAMALLDVLCVDKTGTLTSDKITFESLEVFGKDQKQVADLVAIVAAQTGSGSPTNDAIVAGLTLPVGYEVLQTLAFSSSRKMSGVKVKIGQQKHSVVVGAPEFVAKLAHLSTANSHCIKELTSVGKRVLLVATFDDTDISLKDLKADSGRAVGLVVLVNDLRDGVKKTVEYLQSNGVSLRVISGDNPQTVSYIALQAGIKNADKVITGAELQLISEADWDKTVSKTTIFARVLPEQKERLIETFKRLGKFTGMVGDGVNDALAIKKADLGVVMYAGAAATRRVADIVLLNNSFNSLPLGMRLGNRIMQAIEMLSTLFFHKIIYGVTLLLSTLALGVVYPFGPRHITFMNLLLVTLPAVMWTLFVPTPRHRMSPKNYWRDTLRAVAPIAILSGISVTISYIVLLSLHPNDKLGVSTTTVIIAVLFGIYLVFLVPKMFDVKNNRRALLARIFYVTMVALVVIPSARFSLIRDFFDFTTPSWRSAWPLLIMIIGVMIVQWLVAKRAGNRLKMQRLIK